MIMNRISWEAKLVQLEQLLFFSNSVLEEARPGFLLLFTYVSGYHGHFLYPDVKGTLQGMLLHQHRVKIVRVRGFKIFKKISVYE